MSDLEALLAGIVAYPHEGLRWLVLADWLDDHGQQERAELTRLHRELLRTSTNPEAYPERPAIHERIMELMRGGATPCVPRMTLQLPGGVELPTVFIPPGSFRMGSPESELERQDDELAHEVRLTKGLFLGVAPVTQAQWVSVMGENPSEFQGDTLPVENVSWGNSVSFCGKVTELTGFAVRLPSEAEWEYAARAGTTTPFYWGERLNGTEANCVGINPYGTETTGSHVGKTTPSGSYAKKFPQLWGLVDMIGNVEEWCWNWYDEAYYTNSPIEDPTRPESGSNRVARSGSWRNYARYCRAASRNWRPPHGRRANLGFRIAISPSGQS